MQTTTSNSATLSPETQLAVKPTRRLARRSLVALALLLSFSATAAALPDSASAATAQTNASAPVHTGPGCTYSTAQFANTGFYTQFWTYDASRGGWSSDAWRYTSGNGVIGTGQPGGVQNWSYVRGWERSDGKFQPPPSSSVVYIWARTYSSGEGWHSYKVGRCWQNRHYSGWG